MLELLLHRDRRRDEVLRLVHAHEVLAEIEHQRGLDVAGVDAVLRLDRVVHALRQSEPAPVRRDREHAEAHAKLAGRGRDHRGVAAVRIGQHQLAQARAAHALAGLHQHAQQRVGRQRQRAGRQDVFVRLADRLDRQHQHAHVGGQSPLQAGQHALGDGDVGHHRQMRAVLLGRGDRQNGNGVFRIEPLEILRGQLGPEKCVSRHGGSPLPLLQANAMPATKPLTPERRCRAGASPCAAPRPRGSGRCRARRGPAPSA